MDYAFKTIKEDLQIIRHNMGMATEFMAAFKQFVDGTYESGRITAERMQKLEERVKRLEEGKKE